MNEAQEQKLQAIVQEYLQALDRGEKPERRGILDANPDLRDELAEYFADESKLQAMARSLKTASFGGDGAVSPSLGKVQYFGDYELLEEIARGGMGVVYRARQVSLQRIVALKMILKGEFASEDDVRRFRQEAEAAANLDHANIVPIYEVGEHDGQQYFSMKLIECGTRKTGLEGAAQTVAKVARAIHHAHQRSILHRDLKPSNILIDRSGEPHVADFGLAKNVAAGQEATRSGAIVGTPAYMAPEQARSEKSLTTAVDVWSLGAILYEWLTGRPPFRGDDPISTLMKVAAEDPVAPRSTNSRLDRDLETICLKCLEKDPARRYGSAEALAEDLERRLRGEPILARPVGRVEMLLKWVRRKPAAAALTAVSLLAVVTLLGGALYFNTHLREQVKRAEKGEADARANADSAAAAADSAWANQYVAHANLMASDWDNGNLSRLLDTLEIYRKPPPSSALPDGTGVRSRKDLRGWDWHYQDRLCHQEVLSFKGRKGGEWCVEFSPDGKLLASSGGSIVDYPPTIKLWNAATGAEVLSLELHGNQGAANRFFFSPDGTRLAATIWEPGAFWVKVWDTGTGKEVHAAKMPSANQSNAVFSPDGKRLASSGLGDSSGTVKLWDAATGAEIRSFPGHEVMVHGVAFSPDGKTLASCSFDQTLRLWDVDGDKHRTIKIPQGWSGDVTFSPDGTKLATNGPAGIWLWDVVRGEQVLQCKRHRANQDSWKVVFSPDGTQLAAPHADGTVQLWDTTSGQELRTFKAHAAMVNRVAFSPDGTRLVSASADGTIKLWDISAGREFRTLTEHVEPEDNPPIKHLLPPDFPDLLKAEKTQVDDFFTPHPTTVAFSADGTQLVTGSSQMTHKNGAAFGDVKLWDAATGQELRALKDAGGMSPVISPAGKWLAGARGDSVILCDLATGQIVRTFKSSSNIPGDYFLTVAFSPDGTRLAAVYMAAGIAQLWDTATGEALHTFKEGKWGRISLITFRPDGKLALAQDGTVLLFNPDTGEQTRLWGPSANVKSMAFSPDGTKLAVGRYDKTTTLVDIGKVPHLSATPGFDGIGVSDVNRPSGFSGDELRTLKGHMGAITSVAFSRAGNRLATASEDGTLKLWDVATGQELRTIKAHPRGAVFVTFSRDGGRLASTGKDGTVKLWDARPLTPEIKAELDAAALLDTLYAKPLSHGAVRAALPTRVNISEAVRQKALELAGHYQEEPNLEKYRAAAWNVLRHPYANVFMAQSALAQMETVCAKAPREDSYQALLGIAHYRLGRFEKGHYQQALTLLTKCDQEQPMTLAFLAMTQYQLGRKPEAQATQARLGKLMMSERWAKDRQVQAMLSEAEKVMR